jgi:membrane protein
MKTKRKHYKDKKIKNIFIQTANEWMDDKAPRLGAALAFYSMLSLGPLLLLVLAVAGALFGHEAAQGRIVTQIQGMIGNDGARAIQDMITDSAQKEETGIIASVLGIAMLLFGASGVFVELQSAMNTIWDVEPRPGHSLRGFLRNRFFSFSMVLGTGFLLLTSLVFSASLSALADYSSSFFPEFIILMQSLNFLISFGLISFLFCLIFKYIPDAKVAWRDAWIGAALTALLFSMGKLAIGHYLGQTSFSSSYGAAGSLAVILVWVYYSAQILFFGAEFTQVYAGRYGKHIQPARYAQLAANKK